MPYMTQTFLITCIYSTSLFYQTCWYSLFAEFFSFPFDGMAKAIIHTSIYGWNCALGSSFCTYWINPLRPHSYGPGHSCCFEQQNKKSTNITFIFELPVWLRLRSSATTFSSFRRNLSCWNQCFGLFAFRSFNSTNDKDETRNAMSIS